MMGNTNTEWVSMSDGAIIDTIGQYIKHHRLAQNRTQAQIAEDAGINRWTLSQIEKGEAITMTSLIQILRALDLLNIFKIFNIETGISPIELAKMEKKKRQRARNKGNNEQTGIDW